MKTASTLALLFLLWLPLASGAPVDDLASPDQKVRDAAAAELRATFQGTPETKWLPVVEKIGKGQTKAEVRELLRPFNATAEAGLATGQSYSQSYRLDNEWILVFWFQNDGDLLLNRKLVRSLKHVWTPPPTNFSGIWVVYFINGQKSHQIAYKDGAYFGELITYRPDGSKACVQHYTEAGADGDDTGYHPSGKISYRGQHKSGKRVGTWTWYDEDGNVTSTEEIPAP